MLGFSPLAAAPLADDVGVNPNVVTVFLTSGTSWTVPANWNSAFNSIEVIGAGGSGGVAYNSALDTAKSSGGGGGAYSRISNLTLTPSGSVAYQVGSGGTGNTLGPTTSATANGNAGGDTYFVNTSIVLAKGGSGGGATLSLVTVSGGAGGAAASGVGSVKYSGGSGGAVTIAATATIATGGGGAAGRYGSGISGPDVSISGQGDGGAGDAGYGGFGGTVGTGLNPGSIGVEYGDGYGSGGGPRGQSLTNATVSITGRAGRNYGAGSSASSISAGSFTVASLAGAGGLIIIRYVPAGAVIYIGEGNLSGQGSISTSATVRRNGLTTLSGSGSIVSISNLRLFSLSNLSGVGSSTYSVSFKATGSTSLSGLGLLAPTAGFKALASSALSAQGSAAFLGGKKIGAASDIQAEGIFSATPSFRLIGNSSGFADNPFRLTESEDSRITESGDVRITEFVSENLGISSLIASPTYIAFTSVVYAKTLSAWSFSTIYANVSGQWVEPQAAYQRINGVWKRIN